MQFYQKQVAHEQLAMIFAQTKKQLSHEEVKQKYQLVSA